MRFGAIKENCFETPASLDRYAMSPYLMQADLDPNDKTIEVLEHYAIDRELETNYVFHWKDQLILHGIIDCESISFQEDEALIHCILGYPNPIRDWSVWNTVYLYSLKFFSSISATALNLYRGITNYSLLNKNANCSDIKVFASSINHAAPSLTSYQRLLPVLDYCNEVFHGGEILYHIKCLEKSEDSLSLIYSSTDVVRYPITLVLTNRN